MRKTNQLNMVTSKEAERQAQLFDPRLRPVTNRDLDEVYPEWQMYQPSILSSLYGRLVRCAAIGRKTVDFARDTSRGVELVEVKASAGGGWYENQLSLMWNAGDRAFIMIYNGERIIEHPWRRYVKTLAPGRVQIQP